METRMTPEFLVGIAGWVVVPSTEEENTRRESSLGKKNMNLILYMLNFSSHWQAAEF